MVQTPAFLSFILFLHQNRFCFESVMNVKIINVPINKLKLQSYSTKSVLMEKQYEREERGRCVWTMELFSIISGEIIIFVFSKDQTFRKWSAFENSEQCLILVTHLLLFNFLNVQTINKFLSNNFQQGVCINGKFSGFYYHLFR